MQIENYIKELLYDYSKVVIPGLGAFLTSDKSAYIVENEEKIYPPTKDIIFNDNIKLDDGVLITKIREEEGINKERAIESIQAYIEQLLTKLNADQTYAIDDLGTFVKEKDEYKLHFKQTDEVNYLSDIFNLPVIDLPPKIVIKEEVDKQAELVVNETFENPHESDNNEILPELTQEQEPKFFNDQVLDEEVEQQEDFIYAETNPYQDNEVVNDYISTTTPVVEEPVKSKKGLWVTLMLLLLLGATVFGFGIYNYFLQDGERSNTEEKPALIERQKSVEIEEEKTIGNTTKSTSTDTKRKEESGNSTAALLKGKATKTDKEAIAVVDKTAKPKVTPSESTTKKELYNGYYVVIASFEKETEADEYCKELRNKGFNADILPKSNKYNRVSIYAGKTKADATNVLPKYRAQLNKDAWVLNFKNK